MSVEAGVVIVAGEPVFWHLPEGRSAGGLPDSRALWDVLWEHRLAEGLGFAHSHPGSGVPGPSYTDLTTFAAVELGLGRRLRWWITSSDRIVELAFCGPGKLMYAPTHTSVCMLEEPSWTEQLRKHSEGEQP